MKRLLCNALVFIMLFALCGCTKSSSIKEYEKVEITFITDKEDINVTLTDAEAAKIVGILDGNRYEQGILSCPLYKNVSIKVDNEIFAVACDDCNVIMHLAKAFKLEPA